MQINFQLFLCVFSPTRKCLETSGERGPRIQKNIQMIHFFHFHMMIFSLKFKLPCSRGNFRFFSILFNSIQCVGYSRWVRVWVKQANEKTHTKIQISLPTSHTHTRAIAKGALNSQMKKFNVNSKLEEATLTRFPTFSHSHLFHLTLHRFSFAASLFLHPPHHNVNKIT